MIKVFLLWIINCILSYMLYKYNFYFIIPATSIFTIFLLGKYLLKDIPKYQVIISSLIIVGVNLILYGTIFISLANDPMYDYATQMNIFNYLNLGSIWIRSFMYNIFDIREGISFILISIFPFILCILKPNSETKSEAKEVLTY